jgi:leucyl aminopeptidase
MRVDLSIANAAPRGTGAVILLCPQQDPLVAVQPRDGVTELAARWLKGASFSGKPAETAFFPTWRDDLPAHVVLAGLGHRRDFHPGLLRRTAAAVARLAVRQGWSSCAVRLDLPWTELELTPAEAVRLVGIGLHEGAYRFTTFTSTRETRTLRVHLAVPAGEMKSLVAAGHEAQRIGTAINRTRDLANLPGNEAPPRMVASYARAMARRSGLSCAVWGRDRLAREKCRALLAVAQGSHAEPQMIILRYPGRKKKERPVVLVGKTITFDTGGISIKPARNMEWMKYDKCGGMAVLAAMELVGTVLRPDYPVIGILAAAENMPGSRAARPGDIVRSRGGPSVEIINTDAEGRLVLADALSVARDHQPACVIDLATLTGAASVALGRFRTPLLGNHALLLNALRRAGERTGDRLWPLPLDRDYAAMLSSPFADLKNTGDGSAGTIAGAMFLRHFVPDRLPWAHLDLTAAWEEHDTASAPAGATLFGTTLLCDWIRNGGPAELNA